MCSRYVITNAQLRASLQSLGVAIERGALPASRYNQPPGAPLPAVRSARGTTKRELTGLRWGLVPAWAKSPAPGPINARAETVAALPTFRDAFLHRRCLIPMDAFYEWETIGGRKQPWLFRLRDERPCCFAGLWETYALPDGDHLETCAVLTTAANELVGRIHARMPVLLTEEAEWDCWLNSELTDATAPTRLLRAFPAAQMAATRVDPRMNRINVDDANCMVPYTPPADPQLGFGF